MALHPNRSNGYKLEHGSFLKQLDDFLQRHGGAERENTEILALLKTIEHRW